MVEGQMDIQVEALEGYTTRNVDPARAHILWSVYIYTFYGEESGWSNTQTVALGGSVSVSTSPFPTYNPSPSQTPTVPELSWIIVLPLLVSMLSIAAIIKTKSRNND
jgi:hypothetical protein